MLKVPQLDEMTYDQMVRRAVSRIPVMTDEWTDFNAHDPGITVLETYAWLVDMLNYYMNATGDEHIRKYLKLLGITPREPRPAKGFVVVESEEEEVKIPEGSRLFAGSIPFETVGGVSCRPNRLISYLNEADSKAVDLTAFAGRDGDYAPMFAKEYGESAAVYLGFERPFGKEAQIFVCVKDTGKRNPFSEDFSLCRLRWQYYTREGWKDAQKLLDETCGFLRSGRICLRLEEKEEIFSHPAAQEAAYTLRCVLEENTYDVLPEMGAVYAGIVPVRQTEDRMEGRPAVKIGRTDGCAGFEIPFQADRVFEISLRLEDERGLEEPEIWTRTEDLGQAGYKERVFCLDEEEQVIRFGDGIHGVQPEKGRLVYLETLRSSLWGGGNVRPGEIGGFLEENLPWRATNPLEISGGRDREPVAEALGRMEKELFSQQRMVTGEDYEEAVLRTPGLQIDKVHVIDGRTYGELYGRERDYNEIVLVVKPVSEERRPVLSEAYRKRIEEHLDPLRLLNTKVTVVSPSYVGVTVHGKIALRSRTEQDFEQIERVLREQIDYALLERPFGNRIQLERLYSLLEAQEAVQQVYSLTLEQEGRGARREENGSLALNEDTLGYLKQIDIEFRERK